MCCSLRTVSSGILSLLLLFAPAAVVAQTGQVIGRVLGPDGQAIAFVALQWEGAPGWNAARADGQYVLSVPAGNQTIAAPALAYYFATPQIGEFTILISVIVWWRHWANIRRLVSGTETRIGAKSADKADE